MYLFSMMELWTSQEMRRVSRQAFFWFLLYKRLKLINFDISFFFHIQTFPHNGISEGGRIIAQCTEENHFPMAYVTNLNMFSLYIVLQE